MNSKTRQAMFKNIIDTHGFLKLNICNMAKFIKLIIQSAERNEGKIFINTFNYVHPY